jgi:hypothetical protein
MRGHRVVYAKGYNTTGRKNVGKMAREGIGVGRIGDVESHLWQVTNKSGVRL